MVHAQIIDRYFGHMRCVFAFRDEWVTAQLEEFGEDFLAEYSGELIAKVNL